MEGPRIRFTESFYGNWATCAKIFAALTTMPSHLEMA